MLQVADGIGNSVRKFVSSSSPTHTAVLKTLTLQKKETTKNYNGKWKNLVLP